MLHSVREAGIGFPRDLRIGHIAVFQVLCKKDYRHLVDTGFLAGVPYLFKVREVARAHRAAVLIEVVIVVAEKIGLDLFDKGGEVLFVSIRAELVVLRVVREEVYDRLFVGRELLERCVEHREDLESFLAGFIVEPPALYVVEVFVVLDDLFDYLVDFLLCEGSLTVRKVYDPRILKRRAGQSVLFEERQRSLVLFGRVVLKRDRGKAAVGDVLDHAVGRDKVAVRAEVVGQLELIESGHSVHLLFAEIVCEGHFGGEFYLADAFKVCLVRESERAVACCGIRRKRDRAEKRNQGQAGKEQAEKPLFARCDDRKEYGSRKRRNPCGNAGKARASAAPRAVIRRLSSLGRCCLCFRALFAQKEDKASRLSVRNSACGGFFGEQDPFIVRREACTEVFRVFAQVIYTDGNFKPAVGGGGDRKFGFHPVAGVAVIDLGIIARSREGKYRDKEQDQYRGDRCRKESFCAV